VAISATSSVLTANEWQYAKDIKPGDWVFNRLGKPVRVKTVQTYRAEDCCRVTFDDSLSVDGDMHLSMHTEDQHYRYAVSKYKGLKKRRSAPKLRSVVEMQEIGLFYKPYTKMFSVPTTEPIQLPHQPLGIPPFVYGLWFFGRIRRNQIKIPYEFLDDAIEKLKNAGYQVEKIGPYYGKYERIRTNPSIWDQLRGLQTHKMPIQYLNGSEEQRLELLQGILSTKPCKTINRVGRFAFRTKKKHLSVTVQYLSESLGAKTTLSIDKTRKTYDLKVTRIIPFLPQMGPKRPTAHLARRYVKSIERIPAQLCVHIETDEKDGTFLVGEGFISCR